MLNGGTEQMFSIVLFLAKKYLLACFLSGELI